MAERLNAARGPFVVLIPQRGFSQHTTRATADLDGNEIGNWHQPNTDRVFVEFLESQLHPGSVEVLDLHINDQAFADACVDAYLAMEDGSYLDRYGSVRKPLTGRVSGSAPGI